MDHIQHWLQGKNSLSYDSGKKFVRYINLPADSIDSIERAMKSGQASVLIRRRGKTQSYDKSYQISKEGGFFVHLDPARSLANATQICKVAGFSRGQLANIKFTFKEYCRASGRQGSFVPNDEALQLCERVGLSQKLLKQAIAEKREAIWVPITERLAVYVMLLALIDYI